MIGFLLILGACFFWAIDTLIRYPLMQGEISATQIVFFEHALLSLVFVVIFGRSFKKLFHLKKKDIASFIVVGGVGSALATVTFTQAFSYLNPSLVILLQKFQPVVAVLLAKMVLKEKVQAPFIFWAIVCFAGALLIAFDDIKTVVEAESLNELVYRNAGLGYSLVFFSVIGWGASTVFGKRLLNQGFKHEQVLAGRFLVGFIFLVPVIFTESNLWSFPVEIYSKISLMVFVSGLLAMYLYYNGLRRISARACSLTEMFFPFLAVIVNWIFLGAKLTPTQLMGGAVLLLGSVVIQLKRY